MAVDWRIGTAYRGERATRRRPEVEIAAAQYGVATRGQLLAASLSASSIDRRLADGRLRQLHRGVYAVGHRSLVPAGWQLAAVLACGPGAVLSHRAAAAAWGLRPDSRRRFDVTVPRAGGRRLDGIDAHRSRLEPADHTTLDGVPVTTVARTLLDLAAVVPGHHVVRALDRAEELRLFDLSAVEAAIARSPRRRGMRTLRRALADWRPERARTRSELEIRGLELAAAAGLARPEVNARVAGFEVDLLWRDARMVAELDGYAHHGSRPAFERDRRRDATLTAAGYRVLRFTWRQLDDEPERVAAVLAAVLAR